MAADPELADVRVRNRARLGMSGTVPGMGFDPGSALAVVGPVTVGSAWPPVAFTYDPAKPTPPGAPSGNGWFADFVTTSIVRPYVNIPSIGFSYNPGATSGAPDYSGLASAVVGGTAIVGLGFIGWTLWRAFAPGGRR